MPAVAAELYRLLSEQVILGSADRIRSRETGPGGRTSRYEETRAISDEHPRGRSG
jgi:hypothetical protein